MVEDVAREAGTIDVLVNNFGTSGPGKDLDIAHTDSSVFLDTVNMNLRSVFMASQAAIKYMADQKGGSIINISSVGGLVPDISQVAYRTSKAAINYLTKLIAVHEAKNKNRCNAVLPGMTATEAVEKKLTEEFRSLFLRHIPPEQNGRSGGDRCCGGISGRRRVSVYHWTNSHRIRRLRIGNSCLRRFGRKKL